MEEEINKMGSTYTTEYYSTIKMDEVLVEATTWMRLENVIA